MKVREARANAQTFAESSSHRRREERYTRSRTLRFLLLPFVFLFFVLFCLPSPWRVDDTPYTALERGERESASERSARAPLPPVATTTPATRRNTVESKEPRPKERARVVCLAEPREPDAQIDERAAELASVEIRVIDAASNALLPGASVECMHEPATERYRSGRTRRLHADATGWLRLRVPPGDLRAVAWCDDRAGELRLRVRAGEELRADLALEEMAAVEGRIFDATTGEPLAGASVRFWTFAELDVALSGPDGTFRHPRFPAGNSAHQMRVERDGYGASVRYLSIDEHGGWNLFSPTLEGGDVGGAGTPWLEVALVPTLRIRGRVLDPTHAPIEGATVSAEGYYFVLPDVASPDAAAAETDRRGAFALEGLRSDIGHSVVVSAPGLAAQVLEVPGDQQPEWDLGTIVLRGEHLLVGTVLDPERHPVEDITVQLQSLRAWDTRRSGLDTGARMLGRILETRTDPSGTFVFEGLVADEYRVSVLRDDGVLASEELDLSELQEMGELLLELPVESRTLLGEVRDAHGTVPGAEVEVRRFGFVARVKTDAAGRFRVAGLDDLASYELCATAFGRESGSPLIAEATAWGSQSTILRLGER